MYKRQDFWLDRFLWEQKVAKESESFVATFGRKLSSITLFVHARCGARKVLCTGLMECGDVLVQNSKVQVTPTRGQKIEHAAPLPHAQLGTLHTTQSAQLVPPTTMALNLEVSNKAPALPMASWGLVVCSLCEILCNRGLVRCFWLLRKCAAAVLICVLDAGYGMHTYGAF